MEKIAIVGGGGFGREVKMLINQINQVKPSYEIIGFIDDNIKKGNFIDGYPIICKTNEINNIQYKLNIVLAIGNPTTKEKIAKSINNPNILFPNLVHPNSNIGDSNNLIGQGCIITEGVIITTNVSIGDFVLLNLSCTVGHDVVIDNFSSFMPSVNISGEVVIGKNVYVGTRATIINQITIGKWATIGAGAVIIRDVPNGATVVGNPGKVIKINPEFQ